MRMPEPIRRPSSARTAAGYCPVRYRRMECRTGLACDCRTNVITRPLPGSRSRSCGICPRWANVFDMACGRLKSSTWTAARSTSCLPSASRRQALWTRIDWIVGRDRAPDRQLSPERAPGSWRMAGGFLAKDYPALFKVIWRHFDMHPVADNRANPEFPHLTGGVGYDFVIIFQTDAKAPVWKNFSDHAFHEKEVFLCHQADCRLTEIGRAHV